MKTHIVTWKEHCCGEGSFGGSWKEPRSETFSNEQLATTFSKGLKNQYAGPYDVVEGSVVLAAIINN